MSPNMRIRLDRTICDGFGVCAKHAPKHFSLDDWGYASLIGDGTIDELDRNDVSRALFDCPAHAIVELSDNEFDGDVRPDPAAPATDETPVFEARWGFAQ